ncbi:MAG: hypothetical protein J1F10_04915 [Muribaculaceae bacterium]|nr:hypothetical protein [Muribaculaceae bacterium]
MKIYRLILWSIAVAIVSVFFSCSDESVIEEQTPVNLPYIELSKTADLSNLTDSEKAIIRSVGTRFKTIIDEEGIYHLNVKSGKEVCVSENIYQYYKERIERSNEINAYYGINKRNRLLTRGESPNDYPTDCLAVSLSAILGIPYEVINREFVARYGNKGVDGPDVLNAVGLFAYYQTATIYDVANRDDISNCILILGQSGGQGHAVNGVCVEGEKVIYNDFQYDGIHPSNQPEYETTLQDVNCVIIILGAK